jgi:transposase
LYDHEPERTWRHLDSCHFETHLHARVPRVECPEHGIRQTKVAWAEPRSRFTLLFERFAIDILLESDVAGAARVLGISWDEAHGIMERAVQRGLSRRQVRVPPRLGIDEKALSKGHRYATLVNDLERGIVVDVAEGRTKESLYGCLGAFSMDDLAHVEAIAMDMWEPFFSALKDVVAGAEHIIGHMNQALDQVRRAESKALRAEGDDRLVGSKYLWLYAAENVPEHRQPLDQRDDGLRQLACRPCVALGQVSDGRVEIVGSLRGPDDPQGCARLRTRARTCSCSRPSPPRSDVSA